LKLEYFVAEMTPEDITVQIVISGSKHYRVPLIKFDTHLVIYVVLGTANNLEWQEAYNTVNNSNPSTNIKYLYESLYYQRRLLILV
jgi:hypothetical protein